MSYVNATVVANPVSDEQDGQEFISLLGIQIPALSKIEESTDYRAKAHVLVDAIFDADPRMTEGHFFTITMQP